MGVRPGSGLHVHGLGLRRLPLRPRRRTTIFATGLLLASAAAAVAAVAVLRSGEKSGEGDDPLVSFAVQQPRDDAVIADARPQFRGRGTGRVVVTVLSAGRTVARAETSPRPDGTFAASAPRELPPGTYRARIREHGPAGDIVGEVERAFVRWDLGSSRVKEGRLQGGAQAGEPGPFRRPATAVAFDGVDDFAVVPDSPGLDAARGVTVGAWVQRSGSGRWQVLVAKPGDGRSKLENYGVWLDPADRAIAFFGDGDRYVRVETPASLDGAWHFLVATYHGGQAVLYLDGVRVAAARDRLRLTPNDGDLSIGRAGDDSSYFKGRLAGVVVADEGVSATRVRELYAASAAGDREPPVVTLTTPEPGTETADATPAFAGSASTTILDLQNVVVRVWQGSRPVGRPLHRLGAKRFPSGAWGVEPPDALPPGVYTAQAEQRDRGGNLGRTAPTTFTVRAAAARGGTTILAAGDIADCGSTGDEETAALIDELPGLVVTLGDHAYDWGTQEDFAECYAPTWGRHRARTRPVIGGHEYGERGGEARTYYRYFRAQLRRFGPAATDQRRGWYSYDLGAWHVVVLNTSWREVGLPKADSEQVRWLRAALEASRARCTLAVWHDPVFSSGLNGGSLSYSPLWEELYEHGAELILNGHDHDYERFAPQDPLGRYDSRRGIRQFVVGTGGASHYPFSRGRGVLPNSEVRNDDTFGVLRLTLRRDGYEWQFVPVAGRTFADGGTGRCR